MVTVYEIVPGSPSEKAGIKAGDALHTVNGHEIRDVLDYRFYIFENRLELGLSRNGVFFQVKIHKETYADIGLEFETYLMDKKRSCHNRCIFCFIDQLPDGMRDTLYFKDDDSRLSFLLGNYITLTNLKDEDVERIISMHMSPVNISVHTTNPELRVRMMRNKRAGEVLRYLQVLADAGITLNCQIVLCRGINDGAELDRSMRELSELFPAVASVSVVPAGITKYRDKLYPLSPYSPEECKSIIRQVTAFGDSCLKKYGSRIIFCGDELYIKAGVPLPPEDFYEEFLQIENGVGMIASMRSEFDFAAEAADNKREPRSPSHDLNVAKPENTEDSHIINDTKISPSRSRTVSIATGYAAYSHIRALSYKAEALVNGLKVNVYAIRNDFFGENITVAGLLTGRDLIAQLVDR
ncbi:MAG: DUF512 domain-containing protein, partial [Clostridia bacterium]|nr:DUF512 domain-containing protein [Clostridia bacterium]